MKRIITLLIGLAMMGMTMAGTSTVTGVFVTSIATVNNNLATVVLDGAKGLVSGNIANFKGGVTANVFAGSGAGLTSIPTVNKALTSNVALNSLLLNGQIANQMSVSTANKLSSMLIGQFTNDSNYITTVSTVTSANYAANAGQLNGQIAGQMSVSTASYSLNSGLLGGKSEGTLNVSTSNYSLNSGLLGGKSESTLSVSSSNYAQTSNYSANSGLLGGKAEANLSVSTSNFAPWAGITGKPTTLSGYGITDSIITNNYAGNVTLSGTVKATVSTSNKLSSMAISQFTNDSSYLTTESDPLVQGYAKTKTEGQLNVLSALTSTTANYSLTANYAVNIPAQPTYITTANADLRYLAISAKALTATTADYSLNADQLDGQHGSYYMPASTSLGILTANADLRYATITISYLTTASAYAIFVTATNNAYVTANYNGTVSINGGTSQTPLYIVSSLNNFTQVLLINKATSANASTDFVAANDISNGGNNYYVNFGINSSTYNVSAYDSTGANDGYMYSSDSNLVIGTASTNKSIKFNAGGTTSRNVFMTISSGNVLISGTLTATASTANYIATANNSDLLDGQHGSYYQPVSTAVTTNFTGGVSVNGTISANKIWSTGTITGTTISGSAMNVNGTSTMIGAFSVYPSGMAETNTGIGGLVMSNGSTGAENTAVGYAAMRYNTTGADDTAIGKDALGNNKVGNYNTAIGYTSLFLNVTGNENVAIGGAGAMYNNLTGIQNVCVGTNGFRNNTIGNGNVAIGYDAGRYNVATVEAVSNNTNSLFIGRQSRALFGNGDNEIAIGYNAMGEGSNTSVIGNSSTTKTHIYGTISGNAMQINGLVNGFTFSNGAGSNNGTNMAIGSNSPLGQNTTAYYNVAVGTGTLAQNTTGIGNTAIGSSVLYTNRVGGSQTGVGYNALTVHVTGDANTAVGNCALDVDILGVENTAIGQCSMGYNVNGIHNTAVGSRSFYYPQSGNYNVAIGDSTLTPYPGYFQNPNNGIYIGYGATTATANPVNEIAIGYNTVGEGTNSTVIGNSNTTQSHLYGTAIISTKTPASASAAGVTGMVAWDASYIYVCTATNTWKRVSVSTW